MTKQIRTSLAALAVIVAGSAYLSTPAQAAERFGACNLSTMMRMSDAYCGGGDYGISDISDDGETCSWTVTCY